MISPSPPSPVDASRPAPAAVAPPRRPAGRPRSGRWRRRWVRMVAPFAVLALLVGTTLGARFLEEPNLRADETLTPAGTGRDGSSELAGLLIERGVRIDYVQDIDEAMAAAETGEDAVIFIPRPTLFGAIFASIAPYLPGEQRVVMVAPNNRHLRMVEAEATRAPSRWAAASEEPGCRVPEAVAAGRAAALRYRYAVPDPTLVCYAGGLVREEIGWGPEVSELFVVGAADPFRNRRINEHGNATLAVELLSAYDRVIWAGALPFDVDFELPELPGFRPRVPELDPPERQEIDRDRPAGLAGFFYGYPPAMVAAVVLAAALALLVALARARRPGGPVSEPIPVLVPAVEAVAGRGRLYQRARGRGAALDVFRAAALRRMLPALGLPNAPPPAPETVVAAAAHRTGLPAEYIQHTLYGPPPETDQQLSQAVAALDALVETVTREGGSS